MKRFCISERRSKMNSKLNRRTLLKSGGFALGLPWLEYFAGSQAFAATQTGFTSAGAPKRVMFVFNGLGTIPNEWADINNQSFTCKKILKPLENHKEKMTIIRGLTHASNGGTHEAVELAALTGQPYVGDRKTTKFAAGISIDQHIANTIGNDTLQKSISMSIQGKDQYNPLSHFGHSKPNFPIKDPYTAFDQILSNVNTNHTGAAQTREQKLQQRRAQVLRDTQSRYKELNNRLGQDDRLILEKHLERIEKLVQNLDIQSDQDNDMVSNCLITAPSANTHPLLPAPNAASNIIREEYKMGNKDLDRNQDIVKTYMDIAIQAFSCDVTRVAVLDQGHFHGHGGVSHQADVNNRSAAPNEYDQVLNAGVRCAENINYLVDQLAATPDGFGGNLIDSTLIYWVQSHQDGKNHTLNNFTDVLIGHAGGMFETGKAISIGENRKHTELLNSIGHCYGLNDSGFGKNEWRGNGDLNSELNLNFGS